MSTIGEFLDTWLKEECVGKTRHLYMLTKSMLVLPSYLMGIKYSPIKDRPRRVDAFLYWTSVDIESMEELKRDGYHTDKIIDKLQEVRDAVGKGDFDKAEVTLFELTDLTIPVSQYEDIVECQIGKPQELT